MVVSVIPCIQDGFGVRDDICEFHICVESNDEYFLNNRAFYDISDPSLRNTIMQLENDESLNSARLKPPEWDKIPGGNYHDDLIEMAHIHRHETQHFYTYC